MEWSQRKYRKWIYDHCNEDGRNINQTKQELDLYLAYAPAPVCSVSMNSFWRARSIISAKVLSPFASVEFPVAASPSVIISAASTTVPESPSPEIVGARVIKRRTRVAARKRHVIASFARLCVRFAFLKVGVIEVEAEAYGHYSKKKKIEAETGENDKK
jgi:hypothetical protein